MPRKLRDGQEPKQTFSFSLEPSLKEKFEEAAGSENKGMSEKLRELMVVYLKEHEESGGKGISHK